MTKIVIDMEKGTLTAEGHAGFAGRGRDVVCAAVSAITQTAAAYAKKHGGSAVTGDGRIEIGCRHERYKPVLEATADGLKMIAAQYPLCVRVKVR